jgi:hypothetical protein
MKMRPFALAAQDHYPNLFAAQVAVMAALASPSDDAAKPAPRAPMPNGWLLIA